MEPGHPGVDLGSLSISEQIPAHCVFGLIEAPVSGAFVVVTAMLETTDFFQDQVKQCRKLAAAAQKKTDREFGRRLPHRGEGFLRAKQQDGPAVEPVQNLRSERPLLAK